MGGDKMPVLKISALETRYTYIINSVDVNIV